MMSHRCVFLPLAQLPMIWQSQQKDILLSSRPCEHSLSLSLSLSLELVDRQADTSDSPPLVHLQDELAKEESDEDGCYDDQE